MTQSKNNAAAAAGEDVAPSTTEVPKSALLDSVEHKGYTGGNTNTDPVLLSQPLPQAVIQPQDTGKEEDIFRKDIQKQREKVSDHKKVSANPAGSAGAGQGHGGKKEAEPFSNPGLRDLSPDQKTTAARNLAKMMLYGYERANNFADSKLQISQAKLLKIRLAGKIDLQTIIPIDAETSVTFEQFIQTYNEQVKGTITVDQEWRDEVEPILVEVLSKYGHGLSPEQHLCGLLVTHVIQQGQKFIAQTQTLNSIMAYGLEMTRLNREGQAEPAPVRQPASAQKESIVTPYTPPPAPDLPEGALVILPGDPRYEILSLDATGAIQQQQLRQWGGKDNEKAMASAARQNRKRTGKGGGTQINAEEPESRRRIRRTGPKKK